MYFIKNWKIGYICNWVDVDDGVIIFVFIFVYVFSYDIIGLNDSCLKEKVKCKNVKIYKVFVKMIFIYWI